MNGCVRYTAGEAAVRVDKAAQIYMDFRSEVLTGIYRAVVLGGNF